jgi:hypothetical protein
MQLVGFCTDISDPIDASVRRSEPRASRPIARSDEAFLVDGAAVRNDVLGRGIGEEASVGDAPAA